MCKGINKSEKMMRPGVAFLSSFLCFHSSKTVHWKMWSINILPSHQFQYFSSGSELVTSSLFSWEQRSERFTSTTKGVSVFNASAEILQRCTNMNTRVSERDITKISKSALPGKIASGYSCIMLTRLRAESPVSTYHLEALRLKRACCFCHLSG